MPSQISPVKEISKPAHTPAPLHLPEGDCHVLGVGLLALVG